MVDTLLLSRTLRDVLSPGETLAVAVRLLRARRLELKCKEARDVLASELKSELEAMAPAERETRLHAAVREKMPSAPRSLDSLERLAPLPGATGVEALITYLEGFSGEEGSRLGDPGAMAALRNAGAAGKLAPALQALLGLPLGPKDLDDASFAALERQIPMALSGAEAPEELQCEWAKLHGLGAGDRSELLQLKGAGVELSIEHARRCNWAMERNGLPIIQKVRVTSSGEEPLEGLRLSLHIGPGLSGLLDVPLPSLPPGASHEIDRPDLHLQGERLRNVFERERGGLHLELRDRSRVLLKETRPIDVLAFNEWDRSALPELLAAFVLPNDPSVARIVAVARDLIEEATRDASLSGYQARSRNRVRATADAVYRSLERLGISYVNPPASFDPDTQRIRFPSQVLEHQMGTCLDLAVLVAAALESVGLNPLLVCSADHAVCGVWLVDDWLRTAATDDPVLLRKLVHAGDVLLFDPTVATSKPPLPLAAAERAATERMIDRGGLTFAVDLRSARLARVLPLPVAVQETRAPEDAGDPPGRGRRGAAASPDAAALRGEGGNAGTAGEPQQERRGRHRRIERWKEKLLDLSLRNRLLNFRESIDRTILLNVPELDLLDNRLSSGELLSLEPNVELDREDERVQELLRSRGAEELLREERLELLKSGRILTKHADDDLTRRLVATFRAARTEVEETGSSTLHLALGSLRWLEAGAPGPARTAPLILYPVELVRPTARARLRVRLRDDEPRINETLLEKLRLDFGLEFPELAQLPLDENGVDVKSVLTTLRRGVARLQGFEVLDEGCLAFFSFAKFLMWRDLDQNGEQLLQNDLVRHLVSAEGGSWTGPADFLQPGQLEAEAPPARARLVLDADSSQHVAVDAALRGRTFVLQGPPGTGKSQTITNLIAECLAAGKRVLFVAEKKVALDVVARRLQAVGLGDACLELHSNKANKRAVVLELARTLENTAPPPEPNQRLPEKVEELRRKLAEPAGALHAPTKLGLSLYEAGSRRLELAGTPRLPGELEGALEVDRVLQERRLESLSRISAAAGDVGSVMNHPFRDCRVLEWSALRARQWEVELRALAQAAGGLVTSGDAAAVLLGAPAGLGLPALEAISRFLELCSSGVPEGARELLTRPDSGAAIDRLTAAEALAQGRESARDTVLAVFEPGVFELDLVGLRDSYRKHGDKVAPMRWLFLRGPAGQLERVARGELPSPAETLRHLEAALRAQELRQQLEGEQGFLSQVLGAGARGGETAVATLRALTAFARSWRETLQKCPGSLRPALAAPPQVDAGAAAAAREALVAALAAVRLALDKVSVSLGVVSGRDFCGPDGAFEPRRIAGTAERWLGSMPLLRDWSRFIASEESARQLGLDQVLAALRSGALEAPGLRSAYERAFLEDWVDRTIDHNPVLRAFNGREQDQLVEAYRSEDRALINEGGRKVARALIASKPAASQSALPSSEVGILQREARKKARHLSVRRLLEEIPNLVDRIKPCFLMSPLSIAQYLPAGREPFDLVVFDEASQIPTHDAIGAVARGRQVIVVGDSKQLPPTSFFTVQQDGDQDLEDAGESELEEVLVEEVESILDECVASHLPSLMLRWHYRSRDERLITFSNRRYYEGKLLTFPAPATQREGLGVRLSWIDGTFDRARSRTNRKEAEAVVRHLVEMLLDPSRRSRSVGIVTFNQPQQALIEDLLDQARREHPEIEPYFGDRAPEPVFVKNLENVQGDERDVILFSVTYAPDASGRVWLSFGALNVEGGERRLNVAITRARLQLVVFTGLRPEQIDLARTRARGAEHLKAFLRYAAEDPKAPAPAEPAAETSPPGPLETEIAARLRDRGLVVDPRVGFSGYRVDLAVRDPAAPGAYLLGIECDGPAYAGAPTTRDRDRLRPAVLCGLGWKLHRIWALDWWHDPSGELKRLEAAIAEAGKAGEARRDLPGANAALRPLAGEPGSQESGEEVADRGSPASRPASPPRTAPARGESSQAAAPLPAGAAESPVEAWAPAVPKRLGSQEHFEALTSTAPLVDLMGRIAEEEGPVHRDLLIRKAAGAYGITRLARSIEERFAAALGASDLNLQGDFVWPSGVSPESWTRVRGPTKKGELRDPEHLPPEEMAAAAGRVLQGSVAVARDDLVRGAAALMGYRRVTQRVREAFESAVALLERSGRCTSDGDTVRETRNRLS